MIERSRTLTQEVTDRCWQSEARIQETKPSPLALEKFKELEKRIK